MTYIYFKKHSDIKDIISKAEDKCKEYLKYLMNINSLYKMYYNDKYNGWLNLFIPNYINCNTKLNPNILITTIGTCKAQVSRSSSSFSWSTLDIFSPSRSPGNKEAEPGKIASDPEVAKANPKVPEKIEGGGPQAKGTELTDASPGRNVELKTVIDQPSSGENGELPTVVVLSSPIEVQTLPVEVAKKSAHVRQQIPILHIPNEETYTTHAILPEVSINAFDFPKNIYETLKFLDFLKSVAAATIIAAVIFLIFFFSV